uniref:(northern house mosquito) hypothetical protein n=1 Tax=Culex pipiens TaxID=7175 RepID=A0A8D8FN07_CULPI
MCRTLLSKSLKLRRNHDKTRTHTTTNTYPTWYTRTQTHTHTITKKNTHTKEQKRTFIHIPFVDYYIYFSKETFIVDVNPSEKETQFILKQPKKNSKRSKQNIGLK